MGREVPFDETEKCDVCGKTGAFDIMGDTLCAQCVSGIREEPMNKNTSLVQFAQHWLHGPLPADLMSHLVDVMEEPGYEDTPEKTVHHIVWQAIKYGLENTPEAKEAVKNETG